LNHLGATGPRADDVRVIIKHIDNISSTIRQLLDFSRRQAVAPSAVPLDVASAAAVTHFAPDLTAIINAARRRNRSLWEVLEELDRQPGVLRLSPESRAIVGRFVTDLRAYSELAHERPAGELLYAFLKGSGILAKLAAATGVGKFRLIRLFRERTGLLLGDPAGASAA
jgi:hypothetical protein